MKVPYDYLKRQFRPFTLDTMWENGLRDAISTGDFTLGELSREFERKLCKLTGSKYALALANGTDALELALWANNIGPGDEVITTVNTFIATGASIVTQGATPVFVDSNERFVTDAKKIPELITNKTRAIMPVDFGGQPVDILTIKEIAKAHNLIVIEDSCQALNASYHGYPCGSYADAGCFSFHPQKNLNCIGDGGALVTNDAYVYERLILYRNHGMLTRDDYAICSRNSRMDTANAFVLNWFIGDLNKDNDTRRRHAFKMDAAFKKIPYLTVPERSDYERHSFHLYMILAHNRDKLMKHLQYWGVEARIHYPKPLHLQPAFQHLGYKEGDFPVAEEQAKNMISLPIHQYLKEDEVDYMIEIVEMFYK